MTRKILLIDGDEDELEVLEEAFHLIDKSTLCKQSRNLNEALEYLVHDVPDYIFIDFNMPIENGMECLTKLKEIKKLDRTRIILYSNRSSEDMYKEAIAKGAYTCFKKPSIINVLAKKLKEVLES
jgi:DNA-binding NtrC family response regulator